MVTPLLLSITADLLVIYLRKRKKKKSTLTVRLCTPAIFFFFKKKQIMDTTLINFPSDIIDSSKEHKAHLTKKYLR